MTTFARIYCFFLCTTYDEEWRSGRPIKYLFSTFHNLSIPCIIKYFFSGLGQRTGADDTIFVVVFYFFMTFSRGQTKPRNNQTRFSIRNRNKSYMSIIFNTSYNIVRSSTLYVCNECNTIFIKSLLES